VKARLALAALVITGGGVALTAGTASAQPTSTCYPGVECVNPPAPDVGGTGGSSNPPAPPAVAATESPSGTALPLTGGDVAGLTVIGVGLLAGGTVLVRRGRVRTRETKD
jgi:LPXTG-motif cell wall-anchored protein